MTYRHLVAGALLIGTAACGSTLTSSVRSVTLPEYGASPVPVDSVRLLLPGEIMPAGCVVVGELTGSMVDGEGIGGLVDALRETTGELGANVLQLHSMVPPGWVEDIATSLAGAAAQSVLVGFLSLGTVDDFDPADTPGDIDAEAFALHCLHP